MQAAKSGGAKYVVLVAKHHDGFALFPSAHTDYSVKSSPWLNGKGDLVRLASDSATKPASASESISPPGTATIPLPRPRRLRQVLPLAASRTRPHYGPLTEFWLDGAGSAGRTYDFDKIVQELRTYQPNTLVFADVALYKNADIRWVGSEDGTVPYENWNVIDRSRLPSLATHRSRHTVTQTALVLASQ